MWRLLKQCSRAYHEGRPILADEDYDYLAGRLQGGGRLSGIAGQTRLPVTEMVNMRSGAPPKTADYISRHFGSAEISDKIDGVGAVWHAGVLYSRGDGFHGDPMEHDLSLPAVPFPVRGEIVLPKSTPRPNLRAIVAAAMHHHHRIPEGAHFVAHGGAPKAVLAAAGLRVPHSTVTDEFGGLAQALARRREASPYRLDGLVVQDDRRTVSFKRSTVPPVEATVRGVQWNLTK